MSYDSICRGEQHSLGLLCTHLFRLPVYLTTLLNTSFTSCAGTISRAFVATFNNVVVKLGLRGDFVARLRQARKNEFGRRNRVNERPVRKA